MKAIEICANKEYERLLRLKPKEVNEQLIKDELQKRGFSNMFAHFVGIVEDELYNEVNTKESICWILEYLTFLATAKAYGILDKYD